MGLYKTWFGSWGGGEDKSPNAVSGKQNVVVY